MSGTSMVRLPGASSSTAAAPGHSAAKAALSIGSNHIVFTPKSASSPRAMARLGS
jgi:hypothetical protein